METKRVRRLSWVLGLALVAAMTSSGCKKDDDPKPPSVEKINAKITVTVTGADANDQADFRVQAANGDASQYGAPVWKINGVVQGNEDNVFVNEENFVTNVKTYVFETVKPFDMVSVHLGFSNTDGGPMTINYKVEVDGQVKTNVQNLVLAAGKSEIKNLTYNK